MVTGHHEGDRESAVRSADDLPDAETGQRLMELVLDHYVKHHGVVLRKLIHAQTATIQSLEEIDGATAKQEESLTDSLRELHVVKRYEEMWAEILDLFRSCCLSEPELQKIENLLVTVPKIIRKYYELLVQQDKVLQALIEELQAEKYKRAFAAVDQVQARPNPMTGLTSEIYDDEKMIAVGNADTRGFIYRNIPAKEKRT